MIVLEVKTPQLVVISKWMCVHNFWVEGLEFRNHTSILHREQSYAAEWEDGWKDFYYFGKRDYRRER